MGFKYDQDETGVVFNPLNPRLQNPFSVKPYKFDLFSSIMFTGELKKHGILELIAKLERRGFREFGSGLCL